MNVLITVIFAMAFGAFAMWVLGKKSSVKPPTGGGGSTSDSDRLDKREK